MNEIVNELIKTYVIFERNGKITPVHFIRENGQKISVQKIDKIDDEYLAGNHRIIFCCRHNTSFKYELKYEIGTNLWYLFTI